MLKAFVETTGPLLYPIIVLSIISLAIIFERTWYWLREWLRKDGQLRQQLRRLVVDRSSVRESPDPVARLFYGYLNEPEQLDTALLKAQRQLRAARGPVPILNLVATVSTSFGLLGTVVGVSISFQSLAMNNPTELAAGLAIALNTTIAGLVVFLYSYIAASLFNQLTGRLTTELEEGLNDIKRRLQTKRQVRVEARPATPTPVPKKSNAPSTPAGGTVQAAGAAA